MSMSTHEAIITALWSTIKGDPEMQAIMAHHPPSQEWLYWTWAETDAPFPYLVHRLDDAVVPDQWGMSQATYYLDLWDDSPNAGRILTMRGRLIALLDRSTVEVPGKEVLAARMFLDSTGAVPEPEPGIHHYAMLWTIRYARQADIVEITKRGSD